MTLFIKHIVGELIEQDERFELDHSMTTLVDLHLSHPKKFIDLAHFYNVIPYSRWDNHQFVLGDGNVDLIVTCLSAHIPIKIIKDWDKTAEDMMETRRGN